MTEERGETHSSACRWESLQQICQPANVYLWTDEHDGSCRKSTACTAACPVGLSSDTQWELALLRW